MIVSVCLHYRHNTFRIIIGWTREGVSGCMGDFGLAEDVYASGYFRQNNRANVKLPYKWMALESLNDAIFTEKTDVVSQCMNACMPIYIV